jgi:16S rRNA (cytosine(1402)-N(4))-methyltransferase
MPARGARTRVPVDGVTMDIGVSSMQLDEAERGFSFRFDGPLDMRMSQEGPSAADVVNTMEARDIARIISVLGEERRAGAVARAIAQDRVAKPYLRTSELAGLVERVVGKKPTDPIHPATRTFQALRIYVNQELDELGRALAAAERVLKPGGRLVIVAFHSLEDRIVKRFLRERSGAAPRVRVICRSMIGQRAAAELSKRSARRCVPATPRLRATRRALGDVTRCARTDAAAGTEGAL